MSTMDDFFKEMERAIFDTSSPNTAPVIANIKGRVFVSWPDGRMEVDDDEATVQDRLEWKEFFDPIVSQYRKDAGV